MGIIKILVDDELREEYLRPILDAMDRFPPTVTLPAEPGAWVSETWPPADMPQEDLDKLSRDISRPR